MSRSDGLPRFLYAGAANVVWAARAVRHPNRPLRSRPAAEAVPALGLPGGLPEPVAHTVFGVGTGDGTVHWRHEQLSGWKASGAYRIFVQRGGRTVTRIFKEAVYRPTDVPALTGLDLSPGRAEWQVYTELGQELGSWLPDLEWAEAAPDGTQFRYLMEDLGHRYRRWRRPSEVVRLCGLLPGLHDDLSNAFGSVRISDGFLRLDQDAAKAVLDYAATELTSQHHDGRASPIGAEEWRSMARLYLREADRAFRVGALTGIHGDANLANVLFSRDRTGRVKLIDWEWAGWGLPQMDLASVCKAMPRSIERLGVRAYANAAQLSDFESQWRTFLWCKLQRGLLDVAFLSRQLRGSEAVTHLDLQRHSAAALERAYRAYRELMRDCPGIG